MKILIQLTTVIFLLIHSNGYSQTKSVESISKKKNTTTEIDTKKFKSFIGTYFLAEGDFTLEIVQEKDKMFIISPFSKDLLVQKNGTTLQEPTRGVDLERIKDNKDALKFTQNGYVTTIERVKAKKK
ncbi:MAG: hypothetical protein JXR05_11065 [Flavobacteriaceae bacterium]